MPEYLSPGVYVEEVDAGPKPIEGVSTSTAGAVGVTLFGPTAGKPELVTSFAEFVRKFGGFLPLPDSAQVNAWTGGDDGGRWWQFPLAVKGFFDNGGQRLYVKRVYSAASAKAASADLGQGMVSAVVADTKASDTKVKLNHLVEIKNGTALKIFRGDNGTQVGAGFTVTAFDQATGEVTLNAAIPLALVAKRGDFAEIHARSTDPVAAAKVTLAFQAKSQGAWGNDLKVRVRPVAATVFKILFSAAIAGNAEATATTTAVTTPAGAPPVTTVTVDDPTGFDDDDHVTVNGREYVVKNLNAGAKTFDLEPSRAVGDDLPVGTKIKRLRQANTVAPAGKTLNVWGAAGLYAATTAGAGAIVELSNGTDKETVTVVKVTGSTVEFSAPLANAYFEGNQLRVIEAEVTVRFAPPDGNVVQEVFSNLRLTNDGSMNYLVNHVNARSALVNVTAGPGLSDTDLTLFPVATNGGWVPFTAGDNGFADLSQDDFIGADLGGGKRTGIQSLEDIDEISICVVPGIWAGTVQQALILHCELLRDRFAILDPQDGLSIAQVSAAREGFDTKYAALYYPWLVVRDPLLKRNVEVAPSAHIAGLYARVDVERGVHKAPANEVVRGIVKLATEVNKREHDILNPKNINVLRFFPGRGNRVWGARVATSDASWKYINVRRLFIFVEESIDEGTQWVVFEPNDDALWARVRQTITNFLTTVWRSGALQGLKAEEAFFVRCDHTTMTQDDIDNGRLICLIGIAAVKPAEFVIFRIQQKTLETQPA